MVLSRFQALKVIRLVEPALKGRNGPPFVFITARQRTPSSPSTTHEQVKLCSRHRPAIVAVPAHGTTEATERELARAPPSSKDLCLCHCCSIIAPDICRPFQIASCNCLSRSCWKNDVHVNIWTKYVQLQDQLLCQLPCQLPYLSSC